MHIVTGGAGFIGSAVIWKLNRMGVKDILIIDRLGGDEKWRNLRGLAFDDILDPDRFLEDVRRSGRLPAGAKSLIHMGACSATTEADAGFLLENNYRCSRALAEAALADGVRFIFASSAAVYGDGSLGYGDGPENLFRLRPLNMYGFSKLMFDRWAFQSGALDRLASLRFFNVYGPNEYHKGGMASLVCRAYPGVAGGEGMRLFKSRRPDFADGEQRRDFVYVKDAVEVVWWLLENPEANGLLNVGSGRDETWNSLAAALFKAAGRPPDIGYVDMPDEVRDKYQYLTRADIGRLRAAGCGVSFRPLAEGVRDYVENHLARPNPYLEST